MAKLQISPDLSLPLDAVTQTFAFLARRGAGKTYTASKLCELMLDASAQIVALDPVGVWYGLRLAADGKGKGYQVPVFGGEHGDVPLEPRAGSLIADLIVDRSISAVLDVSNFRKNERKQFVTDFAEQLFHRKKTARSPIHFFLEESQVFVPEKIYRGEERMLGAFADIVKLGRNYGIGVSLISQRPQAVSKEVLNLTECLFVLQTTGPHERKAIEEWIKEKGLDADIKAELPHLEVGYAHVWSPQWLRISKTVKIAPKKTYDASATPTLGMKAVKPKELTPVDVEEIRQAMADTVRRAEENDPAALKREIAQLKKQLQAKATPVEPKIERVEVPVLKDAQITRLEKACIRLSETGTQLVEVASEIKAAIQSLNGQRPQPAPRRTVETIKRSEPPAPPDITDKKLYPAHQRILQALAWYEAIDISPATKKQVALVAGQSAKSSSYTNNLGTLRTAGLISYPSPGMLQLTEAGRSLTEPQPRPTNRELHEKVRGLLYPAQWRIVEALIAVYPDRLSKAELAEASGQSASSSSYTNNLGFLRTLGVIDYPEPGSAVATDLLFPEGHP